MVQERQAWDDKCKQEAEEEKGLAAKAAQVAKEADEAAAVEAEAAAARKAARKAKKKAAEKKAAAKKAAAKKKRTEDPTAGKAGNEDDESTTVLPHARNAQLGKQVQGRVSYLVLLAAIVCLAGPVVCTNEAETLSPFPADEAEARTAFPVSVHVAVECRVMAAH